MRSFAASWVVLLATLVAPVAIATTWASHQVDDRSAYVDAVAPLAHDPQVRRVMADAAATSSVAALQKYVPMALPRQVTDWAQAAATAVVASPEFPTFWRQANEDLHRDVVALLEDPDAERSGYLTVDASPLIAQVLLMLEEHDIPVGLLPRIPLDVPVVERAKVVEAGPAYRLARNVARWVPWIWVGLLALAVLVARGVRGRLRAAGLAVLGLALAAGLVMLAVGPLTDLAVDRAEVGEQAMARVMIDAALGSLTSYARTVLLLALPVGLLMAGASLRSARRSGPDPVLDDPVAPSWH